MTEIINIIDEFDGFPSLSSTVNKIIELFNKGNVDINILEKALQKDPNLSLQVLRLANSPFFGISGEVKSIKDACMIMGLTNVFNLVTAADVINSLNSSDLHLISSSGFWEHSIATGIATTIVLKSAGLEDSNAFLVGLLHDIGKLALDSYKPKLYEKIIIYQEKNECPFINAEKEVANFTHADLGAAIARRWNLSETLADSILNHHDSHQITKNTTLSALHVADFLIKGLDIGDLYNNAICEFHSRSVKKLGIQMSDLAELMVDIEKSVKGNSLLEFV